MLILWRSRASSNHLPAESSVMPSAWLRPAITSSRRKSTASRSFSQSLPLEALNACLKVSNAPLLMRWRSMSATWGASPERPCISLNTRRKTCRMASRSFFASALESMLNRITSVCPATARRMSPSSMGSLSLLWKKSSARRAWPVPGWAASILESRYDRILMKCDLPEPKKPDTHTPMRETMAGSLGCCAVAR